jgi:DNA-binding transcriptional LysR family regulator
MRHPQLCIELIARSGDVDLLAREADIALRFYDPHEERYVATRVGQVRFSLFADRKYIDRFGSPESVDELRTHRIVDHTGYASMATLQRWHAFLSHHPKIVFRPNTSSAFAAAVRAGYGIGLFPNFYSIVAPDLTRLDLQFEAQAPLWLVSHEETNRNARVHAVLSFLIHRFRADRRAWFS